ncbi:hypothetical protein SLS62_005692 [Diatrype stigma]|uniref:Scaffold protein Nfu/NifU N-terminal domain-containing protein n=1 Tax=Diatrype stigma TaxID=117547 RepID=A0AAN9USB0_9PEZI
MSSNRVLRPAASLLSTTARRAQPATYGRAYEVARQAHTASRQLGLSAKPRPTLRAQSLAPAVGPRGTRSIFIQIENTPNADALKFLPNHRVLPEDVQTSFIEYLNPRSTIAPPYPSPLAAQLMNIDGVTAVFYGSDFITVTKSSDANWAHIKPEVFSLITEAITSGQQLVTVSNKDGGAEGQETVEEDSLSYNENDSEVVGMIKELLETRIRPAIQEDGGDIEFRGFNDGIVLLKLRGACRTCDSSTVTLKNGIESMLMHYIEEVKGVHQVQDPEEEIAAKEFAKFEERLRAAKGPDAAPTTPGKGSLDTVPG